MFGRNAVLGLLALLALGCTNADMARPRVDLSVLDEGMAGPRTQVLVLGSVHLSQLPEGFKPETLAPVIDRLAAFKPDIITIEKLSGEACDYIARHPSMYPDGMPRYCHGTATVKAATGLDVPAAIAEVRKLSKDWPAKPAPEQRRRLAMLFLAADDDASALVQWLQLPAAERRAGDGLDDALVASLEKLVTRRNESYQIAASLAARLGLQRVYATDDHTGDYVDVDAAEDETLWKTVQAAWKAAEAKAAPIHQQEEALTKRGDMLALYRFINRPDVLRTVIQADFAAALRDPSTQHYGRMYVTGWEVRNLRMVANIHATFRERPGVRVLSIVGRAHKPWFDGLLGQMQGVDIVDLQQVLK
ncbi:DUF5694 domain-containing protein [Pendulispora rubella]|uniref:DUF5694 domain-containing protein n=1 Tax=Pendulispora rubella TaxID=2741070 RepID=A0ABZ2L1V3_9BACT